MQKLSCIIVDDEPAAIRLLERYIADVPFLNFLTSFTKPLEALAYLESNSVDLVLLDVQMPQLTGVQLSKIINPKTKIIFTTAYSEFALHSYEVAAVDYLLKPIAFERFYKAVSKVLPSEREVLVSNGDTEAYIFIKTDGKHNFNKVFLEDILFVEGLKNYVSVQLKEEQIITYSTLKHLSERLPNNQFIQIHKSYILALAHITRIENDAVWIEERQLPIGNRYRKSFFEMINRRQL
ncbi:LytR/AlgR family response regulator transcription factor [Winogradskyella sp.]|uniref:LytR/AlgR family response regulator transcription factor n=1 Tax=Winogradskyella sp. TaxID=1883156 RepID=UPI003BABB3A3